MKPRAGALIVRGASPHDKAVAAENAAQLVEGGLAGYELAVRRTLGFAAPNTPSLQLGFAVLTDFPDALTAISERARAEMDNMAARAGLRREAAPTFNQYLRALDDIKRLQKEWKKGEIPEGSQLDRFVRTYDPDRHTPDGAGYVHFLRTADPRLADIANALLCVELSPEDPKSHSLVVAAPKSGKSELLKALIFEHLRLNEAAVVLIDTHGDVAKKVSRWPQARDRLMLIKSDGMDGLEACLNPLEPPPDASDRDRESIAELFGPLLREIIANATAELSHQMVTLLQMCVRLLLDVKGATLVELVELCGAKPPANLVTYGKRHKDPMVRRFFSEDFESDIYEKTRPAVRGRLMSLLGVGDFRRMTCGKTTVPLAEAMNSKKLIIFDLSKSTAGPDGAASKIARMIVGQVAAIGYARRGTPRPQRPHTHVILDEAHDYVGESAARIIGELRKCGVYLTIATQGMNKLNASIREEALQSTGVKILGRSDSTTGLLGAMGLNGKEKAERTQLLGTGEFFVRWGARPPFLMQTRNDLADEANQMPEADWLALCERQKAFYSAPESDEPPPVITHTAAQSWGRISREVEP